MTSKETAGTTLRNSAKLFKELRADARQSKQEELDRLWQVLQEMQRAGLQDYTLAQVGRRLERIGGLRTQSLRNTSGKDYRDLIAAFANDVAGKSTGSKPRRSSISTDWIDAITDLELRSWARQMVDENKLLQRQVNDLKSAFKALRVYDPTTRAQAPYSSNDIQPVDDDPNLSSSDMQLLKKSFDASRLVENGWSIQPNGSVTDDLGVAIFPPGFGEFLGKLAKL